MAVRIFLTCVLAGVAAGAVYDVLYAVRVFVGGGKGLRGRIVLVACDLAFFAIYAALYVLLSVWLNFDGLRLYMLLGCALGTIIYIKSLHVFIAFFVKKGYNIIADRVNMRIIHKIRRHRHE